MLRPLVHSLKELWTGSELSTYSNPDGQIILAALIGMHNVIYIIDSLRLSNDWHAYTNSYN